MIVENPTKNPLALSNRLCYFNLILLILIILIVIGYVENSDSDPNKTPIKTCGKLVEKFCKMVDFVWKNMCGLRVG